MPKEKLMKGYSNIEPPTLVDPWVSCATNLHTDNDEVPLAASQGLILDNRKLNAHFVEGEGNPGDFLVLDDDHNVIARAGGNFVDLVSNQEVQGEKYFKNLLRADGFLSGSVTDGILMSFINGQGQLSVWTGGQINGNITAVVNRFNDPYDATNTQAGSKDKKLTDLDAEVHRKSEVLPSAEPAPEADDIRALSIDGTWYNLFGGTRVIPSEYFKSDARKLRSLNIDTQDWNLPEIEPSESTVDNAKNLASLKLGGEDWNIPGAVVKSAEGIQPGTTTVISGITYSCQFLGKLIILHVNFQILPNQKGSDIALRGLPEPYEVQFLVGDSDCVVMIDHDTMIVTVPQSVNTSRTRGYSITYAVR